MLYVFERVSAGLHVPPIDCAGTSVGNTSLVAVDHEELDWLPLFHGAYSLFLSL